ncbi:MAG: serine protease [Lysobacter sp.]|nr:serine protease [Lysobacter sp.]
MKFKSFAVMSSVFVSSLAMGAAFAAGPSQAAQLAAAKPGAQSSHKSSGNWMRDQVVLRQMQMMIRHTGRPMTAAEIDRALNTRIVGGTTATASDNPFQVALLNKSVASNYDAQFCGGTLVKANVVVTAAHCVYGTSASQLQVLTGTRSLASGGTRRNVSSIAIHSSYNNNTLDYDVAVLTLSSSATGIPLASLASADPAAGTNLLVTGWGNTSATGSSYPTALRKATVPLIATSTCNGSSVYNGAITARMICAGYLAGGVDSCQGDSGGPLTRSSTLTGIVSWGQGCAQRNKPGVYTRVSNSSVNSFIRARAGL